MKQNLRCRFLNIYLLRQYYFLLILLCVLCSVFGMFVLELFRGALLLQEVSYLPYTDYYLVRVRHQNYAVPTDDTRLGVDGAVAVRYMHYFENVDDIMITELCSAQTDLVRFNKNLSVSESPSGKFPWTVVGESAYDDAFRNAERVLVKGRHIAKSDENAALIDIELANANHLDIGDVFTTEAGDRFSIVGIYQTIEIMDAINDAMDVPHNMIFASDKPTDAKRMSTCNLYVSFRYPYAPAEIAQFAEKLTQLLASDADTTFSLTSVKQLNRDSNRGALSMLRLSGCCIVIMCAIMGIAVYAFISTFYRRRQKEFLLYYALGEKRRWILRDFFLELSIILVPSSVIGVLLCNVFCLCYLKGIISYFEKMVSIDSIFSTSTLSLNKTESVSAGIYNRLQTHHFLTDSVLFIVFFFLITGVCLWMIHRSSKKWSVMTMFSEK